MCHLAVPFVDDTGLEGLLKDPALEAHRREVEPGTVLFEVNQPTEWLFYIHEGQVRLYQHASDGSERLVEIFGAGHWAGSEALAQRSRHGHRAVAISRTTLTRVPVARLLGCLAEHPRVSVQLIQGLAEKLQLAREDAARLVFDDCNSRLLKTLVRFSTSSAATPVEEGVVLRITHQQLAQAVGVARETVSLALTHLRQQNLLRTGRNRLTFNPDVLERFTTRQHSASDVRSSASDVRIREAV